MEVTMSENDVKAQGMFDLFKFADKELIDKVLKIAKAIEVENLEDGVTRVSIYLSNKDK
jgi:hypothetical protein